MSVFPQYDIMGIMNVLNGHDAKCFLCCRRVGLDVTVNVNIAGMKRTYKATLRRNSPRDIQVLNMNWQ